MKNLRTKLSYTLYILLVAFLFTSCDGYPIHTVVEGDQAMIVYKMEKIDAGLSKNGKYIYAVTDASGTGWKLKSDKVFAVGDTLKIDKL
jgi:hypothetical protein